MADPQWKVDAAKKADEYAMKAAKAEGLTSWLYLQAAKICRWCSK